MAGYTVARYSLTGCPNGSFVIPFNDVVDIVYGCMFSMLHRVTPKLTATIARLDKFGFNLVGDACMMQQTNVFSWPGKFHYLLLLALLVRHSSMVSSLVQECCAVVSAASGHREFTAGSGQSASARTMA